MCTTSKKRELIWEFLLKKCRYGDYDYTITKILKRMTAMLNWLHDRSYSLSQNDVSDTPRVIA